ncbi:hypothetical protein F4859DRAFT_468270 [Xylaria cf. heliscus]|nr:hypothetical protein F4859DRAFT_468270 [Xylaria cf. heliscus]
MLCPLVAYPCPNAGAMTSHLLLFFFCSMRILRFALGHPVIPPSPVRFPPTLPSMTRSGSGRDRDRDSDREA